jgi:TRAP transporter 4TM/12TM fusion protein
MMRQLTGITGTAVAIWAAVAALFHIYTSGFGFLEPREMRSAHLLLLVPLAFFLYPARPGKSPENRPSLPDLVIAVLAVAANVYSYLEAGRINLRFENVTPLLPAELVFGAILTVIILEALRRAVTPVLAGLLGVGIIYLFVTEYMPGLLYYRNMPFEEIVETMYLLNGMGIYGSITGISATMVAVFIAFGAMIEVSGVGRLFHNLGTKVAGRHSGGPAKVEVISSALFGTISGSSTANVFATGSFTIPAMIKLGYRKHFAAGVEAASSVGGQIMPPVMGAGAFVMAEITNIPYSQIMIAAILGSLLYFFMILVSVHFEAKRLGLAGVDPKEIPTWRVVARDAHLLLPVILLMVLLLNNFSPHFSAFWSIVATFVVSWLRKDTRIGPALAFRILANAGRNMTVVALACAGASMFVACLTVTGVIISISNIITSVSEGNILIAGAMLMITTLILGMGVPTTAAYVIGASVGASTLIGMKVDMLAAHMFVFYFSILADATPPVSVASYAAASIARTDPMKVGVVAFRLALAGFIVGFNYLYTPALLMKGPTTDIVAEVLVNALGLTLVAASLSGYFAGRLAPVWRIAIGVGALVLVMLETESVWLRIAAQAAMAAILYLRPHWFAPTVTAPAAVAAPKD